ncbi:hypothetical protein TWF225_004060 [Orbilia oligospora]|nr:hypothetical protein TWF225_004060 [Orbilia oligospora]KAF3187837.1 hypothetical protein TWF225_004060 [Orbilia oligospora]KAF3248109.1 hypothetical protein TWF128_008469 [Orbilia oligospora]KAF3248110.1 hypothetical protein TWF128_008469 [Orbilia oligospora]KAF3256136.1 hypothetical protein TWF217_006394 [Orbilia oligospora]
MSQPSTDPDPLPERAAFPIQHLSRYFLDRQQGLSSDLGLALSQRAAVNADGAAGSDNNGGGISVPRPAVIKPDNATSSAATRNAEYIAAIERGPFPKDGSNTSPSNLNIEQLRPERIERNPYEPSTWNKITESFNTVPYTAKVSIYRTLIILWNLPENIVRGKRRLFSPPPKPQTLPAPATIPATTGAQGPKKPSRVGKFFQWLFSKDMMVMHGFLFTLALNGGFALWVWVHANVYLDPHTWRLRRFVTNSLSAWTAFTSLEIWIAIMLGLWNLGGAYLIIMGPTLLVNWTKQGIRWMFSSFKTGGRPPIRARSTEKPKFQSCFVSIFGIYFLIMILWPILASTIPAPRLRIDRYPKRCEGGGEWDFRVILNGRFQPKNLTRGVVMIREMKGEKAGRQTVYITEDYVNATWLRTEEKVVLRRASIPWEDEAVYVSEVTYRFPYLQTEWEKSGWRSLPDVKRETGGNYTAILTYPETGRNETINGRFPYLEDQSGLRLDEMGLIPDVKRSWRAVASAADSCSWGPDAKLLENTDVTARNMVGEGYPIMLTDMTRFGSCSELTVCANRRRQVVDGLPWAVGEEGKKVLDAMLIVPLGLILAEQIRWGSCCGDGFEPYKAAPAPA